METLNQEIIMIKNENITLQKLIDEGTLEYDDMLLENRAICDAKEVREKDCEDALDALVELQKQFKLIQLERDEYIKKDNNRNNNIILSPSKKNSSNNYLFPDESNPNVKDLQNKLIQSEDARTASQTRTADLSKVLRASQIRSEELLDENQR